MAKNIKVRANNTVHYVANCKQLMSLLSEDERLGWYNRFAKLGINKRYLASIVNLAISDEYDVAHYNCDNRPCTANYILSYVASHYEEVQNNPFCTNPSEWKDNYINTHGE